MIPEGTRFEGPLRVRLDRIIFTQCEPRYLRRVQHYYDLLTDPAHAGADTGVVMLTPYGLPGFYTPLDGHHRIVAAFLAGRVDVLALIEHPPSAAEPEPREPRERGRPRPWALFGLALAASALVGLVASVLLVITRETRQAGSSVADRENRS